MFGDSNKPRNLHFGGGSTPTVKAICPTGMRLLASSCGHKHDDLRSQLGLNMGFDVVECFNPPNPEKREKKRTSKNNSAWSTRSA